MNGQTHRIRVRYGETDQMSVAHHGSYVAWLEEARIAWMRSHGLSYRDIEASGTGMPVIEVQITYRRPARFDDVLELTTTAKAAGPSRVVFSTAISRGDEHLATGNVTVAAVGKDGKPVRIPDEVKQLFA